MITNQGKTVIKNFFGQQTQQIGGALALGVGSDAATLTDTALDFEVVRIPVTAVAPDLDNNRIVFKAVLPAGQIGTIYEVGLYHTAASDQGVTLRLTDTTISTWVNAAISTSNARTSGNTVQVAASASAVVQASLDGIHADLSRFASGDSLNVALTADANTASVRISLGNDSNNFTTWTLTPSAGYNTLRQAFSAGVKTGNPDFSAITWIAIGVTAKAAGATNVYVDDVRMEALITGDELVARTVLTTPKTVDTTIPTEVEYSLGISV